MKQDNPVSGEVFALQVRMFLNDAADRVRVDGLPVHLSDTDWHIARAAPLLGQDNDEVFGGILGLTDAEIGALRAEGVI